MRRNNLGQFEKKPSFKIRTLPVLCLLIATVAGSGFFSLQRVEEPLILESPLSTHPLVIGPRIVYASDLKPVSVETKIRMKFGNKAAIMLAIARPESGLNPRAQGWNCRYPNARGKLVSKPCKKEDRGKAWSVDCGVFQINHPGTVCPEDLFDIDRNLERAEQKLNSQGLSAWSVFNSGLYRRYL